MLVDQQEVALEVFNGYPGCEAGDITSALSALMHVGMLARSNTESFPLLPGRYHVATSGIEGVAVLPDGEDQEGWRYLKGLRHFQDKRWEICMLSICGMNSSGLSPLRVTLPLNFKRLIRRLAMPGFHKKVINDTTVELGTL